MTLCSIDVVWGVGGSDKLLLDKPPPTALSPTVAALRLDYLPLQLRVTGL